MAFVNKGGYAISYECSELIDELKEDIAEFGGERIVAVWCKRYEGVVLYTNYDFIVEDEPIEKNELLQGEFVKRMTMTALLTLLERQNEIV